METKPRKAGMMCTTGAQGVGKTFQNMQIIKKYVVDKVETKVPGRRCLIFDTNGEYTREEFEKNGISNFDPKRIALKDVIEWSKSGPIECRRLDAKQATPAQKKEALQFLMQKFENGMIVLEDINNFTLNLTHMEDVIGGLVNLRHKGVDVLISFQSLRPVEPRIWQNSRWIRMHYQADNVNAIKNKVTHYILFKISQIMVNNRYFNGDEHFFVTIYNLEGRKVKGDFTREEFNQACRQFLATNKKEVKEYQELHGLGSKENAINKLVDQYGIEYYGNSN